MEQLANKSKSIWSKTTGKLSKIEEHIVQNGLGLLFEPFGLQVDARSRNGPEKVELRIDFGSLLGGQIDRKSILCFSLSFDNLKK